MSTLVKGNNNHRPLNETPEGQRFLNYQSSYNKVVVHRIATAASQSSTEMPPMVYPPSHPKAGQPMTPEDAAAVFPDAMIASEADPNLNPAPQANVSKTGIKKPGGAGGFKAAIQKSAKFGKKTMSDLAWQQAQRPSPRAYQQ